MTTNRDNWIPPMEPGDEPLDPDILLITNWLGDELSPEQVAQVEERLVNDEAFHAKAAPYVEMWAERKEHPAELAVVRPRRLLRWQAMGTRARAASLIAAVLLLMVGPAVVAYRIGFSSGYEEGEIFSPGENVERIYHGTLVHLRAGARCACESRPFWWRNAMGLRGEAVIEVSWLDRVLDLHTPAGLVTMRPGIYAVRVSEGDNRETLVTVGRGSVTLTGEAEPKVLELKAGEYGRLGADVAPVRGVGGGGWPAIGRR